MKSIQSAIWQLDKNQAVDEVKMLEQIKSDSLGPNRLRAHLLGIFAAVALLLAAIGVYGVISELQRTLNVAAYQAYLEGNYHRLQQTGACLVRAREHYERAIVLDPEYAAPYAGLVVSDVRSSLFTACCDSI